MIDDPNIPQGDPGKEQMDGSTHVIPLLSEKLSVTKRVVETGTVRLTKRVEEHTETVEIPLTNVAWEVEHVPLDRVVEEEPPVRYEGDTTVYPVMAERVTVLRELVLVEEVRVTRMIATTTETSTHVLRRETLIEERLPLTSTRSAG